MPVANVRGPAYPAPQLLNLLKVCCREAGSATELLACVAFSLRNAAKPKDFVLIAVGKEDCEPVLGHLVVAQWQFTNIK